MSCNRTIAIIIIPELFEAGEMGVTPRPARGVGGAEIVRLRGS